MKTTLALALVAAFLGGCVIVPDHDRYRGDRYYGQRYDREYYDDRRSIPYRNDGDYARRHWRDGRDDADRGRDRREWNND